MRIVNRFLVLTAALIALNVAAAISKTRTETVGPFNMVNLDSDTMMARHQDKKMINPWGIASLGAGDVFWINDEGTGVSELIDGQGIISAGLPEVTIPPAKGQPAPSHPTGIVANTTNQFVIGKGGPASFIFDTIDGTIAAWNTSSNAAAVTMVDNSGRAQYTGLAMATIGASVFLYAANAGGTVDVLDGNFNAVAATGGFADPNLPTGLTPYGIANVDGNLFVTYAKNLDATGVVDEFGPNGNLIMRFATGGTLNEPWAIALAPANFGAVSNDLLVGNFGDGKIGAYNRTTGKFVGLLASSKGNPVQIPGLWSLIVGGNVEGVKNPNALYFTAGPDGQQDGLFGFIASDSAGKTPTPAPTRRPIPTPRPTRHPPKTRPTPTRTAKATPTPTGPVGIY